MLPPSTISRLDNYSAQTSHHPARQAAADSRHGVYGNNGRSLQSNPLRSPDTWPSSPRRRLKWNDWGQSGEKRGDLLSTEVREQSIWGRHGADHHFEKKKKKKKILEKVSGGPGIWKHAAQPFHSLCLAARAASVWLMPQRGFAVACGMHTQRAL